MVRLSRNEKQTHRLNSRHEMGPSGLTLALTLTLTFQGQILNLLYLSQKWSDCHEMKSEHIDWTLGWNGTIGFDLGLDLEFSRSNTELAISQPKMVRLPRNEKRTHRLNSSPQMWPLDLTLALTLNLNFQWKVKYEICYISTKSGPIATRRKANISIWTLGLKFDNGFDLGHDLDIWIFKVICDLDHLVTKVRCKDLPDSDRGDFSCRRAVDSSSFDWRCPGTSNWLSAFVLMFDDVIGLNPLHAKFWEWT